MLYADIFCRNHLAVEQCGLGAVLPVVILDESEGILNELHIFRIVVDLDSEELCSLHESVDTYSKVLTADVDEAGIKERKHSLLLECLEVLVICKLYLMYKVDDLRKVCQIVTSILYCILDAAVEIDCEHALRSGRDTAGTEGVAESVVLDLVAQTAA